MYTEKQQLIRDRRLIRDGVSPDRRKEAIGRNYYAFLHNKTNVSDTVLPGTSYCSLIITKSKIYNKGNLRTGET